MWSMCAVVQSYGGYGLFWSLVKQCLGRDTGANNYSHIRLCFGNKLAGEQSCKSAFQKHWLWQTQGKYKCRQCNYNIQNNFCFKIYCNHWKREKAFLEWITSAYRTCCKSEMLCLFFLKCNSGGFWPGNLARFILVSFKLRIKVQTVWS